MPRQESFVKKVTHKNPLPNSHTRAPSTASGPPPSRREAIYAHQRRQDRRYLRFAHLSEFAIRKKAENEKFSAFCFAVDILLAAGASPRPTFFNIPSRARYITSPQGDISYAAGVYHACKASISLRPRNVGVGASTTRAVFIISLVST